MLAAAAILAFPTALVAQAGPPRDVERAVAIARERSPLLTLATGRRLVAEGRGRADAAWPNPIAEWRRENLDSPLQPDIFATLQVPFSITGRQFVLREASSFAARRGRADSVVAMRQLDHDVVRAYWRASLALELAAIADTELIARQSTATFDAQRFREGAVAEVAVLRTQLEADRARIAAVGARAEAVRATTDLARILGVDVRSVDRLAPLSPDTLGEIASADTNWTTVRDRRDDLASLRLQATENQRRWSAEVRGAVGDVSVIGGYKKTSGYTTGLFGVLLPLPLFNRNDGPRVRARGEYLIAQAELLNAERRVQGEVLAAAQAYEAVRAADRDGVALLDARAVEVAQIAEASYREGAISLIELLEAQRARADARAAAARWIVDAHLAELELRRATGAPLLRNP